MIYALVLALVTNPVGLQIRVDGSGFLRLAKASQLLFASEATLVDQDGVLQTADGAVIIPRVHLPIGCYKISVTLNGEVKATTPSGVQKAGQLVLAMLPEKVAQSGLFRCSLHADLSQPGDGLAGVIQTSSLKDKPEPAIVTKTAVESQKLKIVVAKLSEVDHDHITLGDIATMVGPKELQAKAQTVDLGPTPKIGTFIRFESQFIAPRLAMVGIKPDEFSLVVPDSATAERPYQTVTEDQLTEAAMIAIREKYDVGQDLKPDSKIQEWKLPKGDLVLSTTLYSKTDRSISAVIVADVDGRRAGTQNITLVPAEEQQGVKVGDQVTIRIRSAGAIVEVTGKAKTAGWVGQRVTVLADTGSTHTAKVISSSLVEVQL